MDMHELSGQTLRWGPSSARESREGAIFGWWPYAVVASILGFICAAFSGISALMLALFSSTLVSQGVLVEPSRLVIKGVLFCVFCFGWLLLLCKLKKGRGGAAGVDALRPRDLSCLGGSRALCLVGLTVAAALVLPNLTRYPFPEPDEAHHLNVARNVAVHGAYASGRPESGFTYFDPYDSVGPAVILPVALCFRMAGVGILSARAAIAVSFLLLCGVAFFFMLPVYGTSGSLAAVLMLIGMPGSIYLARALYGEVPAFLFLLVGLMAWRMALRDGGSGAAFWGVLSGAAVGGMLLAKAVFVLLIWPATGVILYDWMTFRRIRWVHIVAPGGGAGAIMLMWWASQHLLGESASGNVLGTLGLYAHYFMFGFHSVPVALGWLVRHPLLLAGGGGAMGWSLPRLFGERYDPALALLFLSIPFFTYWWVFFTPGSIARYMWYPSVGAGLLIGPMCWEMVRRAWSGGGAIPKRVLLATVVFLLVLPMTWETVRQVVWVSSHDDMRDLRMLAGYVEQLPKETSIAVTHWPLERTLDFLTDRPVARYSAKADGAEAYDIVIMNAFAEAPELSGYDRSETFGRYRVAHRRESP